MGVMVTGFIYRCAIGLKDLGERLHWSWLISFGYSLREVAYHGKVK